MVNRKTLSLRLCVCRVRNKTIDATMRFLFERFVVFDNTCRCRIGGDSPPSFYPCATSMLCVLSSEVKQANMQAQDTVQARPIIAQLLVRLLLPSAWSSASGASRFLLTRAELLLERGQSSKGLRFLALTALRSTGDTGISSGSSATIESGIASDGWLTTRLVRLVEGGVAR